MDKRVWIRRVLQTVLLFSFVYVSIRSLDHMLSEETNISIEYKSGTIKLPALTICPYVLQNSDGIKFVAGQNKTLLQAFESINTLDISEIISIEYKLVESLRTLEKRYK